jgi:predicted nucleic acid-binding protein
MIIVVDSDGLIGLFNKDDAHFQSTQSILLNLTKKSTKFIYPVTTITEATAILKIRLKKPELADQITNLLLSDQLIIEPVDEYLLKEGAKLLTGGSSAHDTLFDAIVAAIAKKYKADAIFSFDKFYNTKGFKLASDL